MSKVKREPVTTSWENYGTTCRKCYEILPRKKWPVPSEIKNELKSSIESQLRDKCSGVGVNIGPLPSRLEGYLISHSPPNYCIDPVFTDHVFCGGRCGGLSKQRNLKSTYDRFKTNAPCKDLGQNTPYAIKTECVAKPKTIGVGSKEINITATYRIDYMTEVIDGPCKGVSAVESRTYERTYTGKYFIKMYGHKQVDFYKKHHCCEKNRPVSC